MRFVKLVILILLSLNLYGEEILSPRSATKKAYEDFGQLDWYTDGTFDYGRNGAPIPPSFNCFNSEGKYKFKQYSLEDFICNSKSIAFRDNYFSSLYKLIIKENPNLKDKALKIARQRIKESKKGCLIYSKKEYDDTYEFKDVFNIHASVQCIKSYYRDYTAKLALMVYNNDKELFKRIYTKDYEKFKEAFEDFLNSVYPGMYDEEKENKYKDRYEEFLNKYKDYRYGRNTSKAIDLIYIILVQYDLIDEKGNIKFEYNMQSGSDSKWYIIRSRERISQNLCIFMWYGTNYDLSIVSDSEFSGEESTRWKTFINLAFVFFIDIFRDGKELAVINDIDEVILNFKNISGNKIEFKIIYENLKHYKDILLKGVAVDEYGKFGIESNYDNKIDKDYIVIEYFINMKLATLASELMINRAGLLFFEDCSKLYKFKWINDKAFRD